MTFPTLFHLGKGGVVFSWLIATEGDTIITRYGQLSGKHQEARKVATPKNVGRSNATTGSQQADIEAKAMWQAKLDRKYSESLETAKEPLLLPMLAHKFDSKRVQFPCHVQPKLDGVRCLAVSDVDATVTLYSRNGKVYKVPHIQEALSFMPANSVLDGELYIHHSTLQRINSLVKKNRPESKELKFFAYDVPRWKGVEDKPWSDRNQDLLEAEHANEHLVMMPTLIARCESDIHEFQRMFVEGGYEGAIVRLFDALYLFGYRSYALLKVKTFQDDEFIVTGAEDGEGKFKGCVIWECITHEGKGFSVVPRGTTEQRQDWYANAESFVGRKLTVRFFNYTPDGIPFHPVGHAFRLEEDL